jgi:tetratricopeptide (TPR) repeat protein
MPDLNPSRPLLAVLLLTVSAWTSASAAEDAMEARLRQLQGGWAEAVYATPHDRQEAAFTALEQRATQLAESHPQRAEPLVWEAIILSSHAGATGGLKALSRVKQARVLLEKAEAIAPEVLDGSVYTSLGSLYYQVPGWPLGFGNDKLAERYLQRALQVNPDGIDPNFFYGDFLYAQGRYREAVDYLQRALQAAPRAQRELADRGRRDEARAVLARSLAKL